MTAPAKPRIGPLPPGTLTEDERHALVFRGLSNKSLIRRGQIIGLDMAIRLVLAHRNNPLPFLENELKRLVES